MEPSKTFGAWDYAIFAAMVGTSISIGLYYALTSRKGNNLEKYLFASKSMPFVPVALSVLASFESSILMLGMPAEGYAYGMQYVLGELGYTAGRLLEQILLLTFLKKLDLVSPFEYLERRFESRGLRYAATGVGCVRQIFYMSVVLYGQGMALETATGFSIYGSIFVTAGVAVVYTSIGGLKAVIWTDVLQIIFMTAGLLAIVTKGTIDGGGMTEIWTRAVRAGRLDYDFDLDPTVRHTVWNLIFGSVFHGIGFLFRPAVLQRISSVRTVKDATRSLFLTLIGFPLIVCLGTTSGVVAYGYYDYKGCDPVASKQVKNYNQIMPFMMLDVFRKYPGLSGVFLAAVFSASLSTISSCLSALSNIVVEDFFRRTKPSMSEVKCLVVAKITVVVSGILSAGLSLLVSKLGIITIIQIYVVFVSCIIGPGNGLFYLGVLCPFVNTKSAVIALVCGLGVMAWLVIGSMVSPGVRTFPSLPSAPTDMCPLNVTIIDEAAADAPKYTGHGLDAFYSLSYILYAGLGFLTVVVVGIALSLATGGNKTYSRSKYILPVGYKLWSCLKPYWEGKDRKCSRDEDIKLVEGITCTPAEQEKDENNKLV